MDSIFAQQGMVKNSMIYEKIKKGTDIVANKYKIIDIIYLFGSYSKKTSNIMSDLDIAFSLSRLPDYNELLEIISGTINLYEAETGINTDVVIFENSGLSMRHQIILYGEILFCRDEQKRINLQSQTLKMYYDFEYYSDIYNSKLLRFMKSGSFNKLSPRKMEVPEYNE